MALVESDLFEMLNGCATGTLDPSTVKFKERCGEMLLHFQQTSCYCTFKRLTVLAAVVVVHPG